jgi:hypothetical protein
MLLPAALPQCPVTLFEFPITFLGAHCWDCGDDVFHLPCHQGMSPRLSGEVILPGANRQLDLEEGLVLLASQDEGLRHTIEPGEAQEPVR